MSLNSFEEQVVGGVLKAGRQFTAVVFWAPICCLPFDPIGARHPGMEPREKKPQRHRHEDREAKKVGKTVRAIPG